MGHHVYMTYYLVFNMEGHFKFGNPITIPRRQRMKSLVFGHYGWVCACCGESTPEFLTIDHFNEDGAEHRRKKDVRSQGLYGWLVRQYQTQGQWPAGFQTLCRNCNYGKYINGGICPHEKQEEFVRFDMRGWGDEGSDFEDWDNS